MAHDTPNLVEGQLSSQGMRFGIVAARFNDFICQHLISGAVDALTRHGAKASDITIVRVPGSYEIPLAVKALAQQKSVDAIIALGAIIRGSTAHFDLVCNEAARGISSLQLQYDIPVAFGIITTDTIEQAIERAGCKAGNKGVEAAMAAIETAAILRKLKGQA